MPVHVHADIRPLTQQEFGRIAYGVMDHAFAVHNEMGRFFEEHIYRDAVAGRVSGSQTEVLIEVRFEDFRKDYFIDLLVENGAVFELKSVESLGAAHRSQLLNYLLLTELSHGKLVNFAPELVEHEFVNTHLRLADRTAFRVIERGWQDPGPAERPVRPWFVAFLRDIGAGLDVHLYESAVSHLFGGDDAVLQDVSVFTEHRQLGRKGLRLTSPGWTFKVTAFADPNLTRFEDHARRFLAHTDLRGMHWINVSRQHVSFSTIETSRQKYW